MNYIEKFQTLSKEDAIQSVVEALNMKSIDALEESAQSEINRMQKTLDKYPDLWPITKVKYKNKIAALRKTAAKE